MYFKLYNNNHENIQLPFTGRIANGPDKKYVGLLNYEGSLSLFLISNMSRCERMVDRFMLLHYRRAVVLKHFYYHVFFSLALASAPTPPRAFYQVINRYSWMKGKNDLKKKSFHAGAGNSVYAWPIFRTAHSKCFTFYFFSKLVCFLRFQGTSVLRFENHCSRRYSFRIFNYIF